MENKSISVLFPSYNDGVTIMGLVNDAISVLGDLNRDYEVIIVNDGSTDNTQEVLDELKKKSDKIKVIHHLQNKGYGAALRTGFANSTKDLIFYTDGDGQYDVRELSLLLSFLEDDVDVINGYKIRRSDPLYRIIIGRVYSLIVSIAFNIKLRDVTCDFRLMRRSIFDKIKLQYNSGAVCVEMMKKIQDAGFAIAQTPVHHYPRRYGSSRAFTFINLIKMTGELLKFWQEGFVKKK